MIFVLVAVAAFYGAVLLVGVGMLVVASGSSVVLALRRRRFPQLWRAQLAVTLLLVLAGAAAATLGLAWFGWFGGNVLAAAFAARNS